MREIIFPENIIKIISVLNYSGHTAYAVGGCIRDSILGLRPDDWDVTTSARPEEVMAIFGDAALPTGLKHGTVTVKMDGNVEVTTFRTEGTYSDHRRPDSVSFAATVEEDLSRRDFTMNAMACAPGGEIVDPFGGQKDIEMRLIRCVGDAAERFDEDALRMLRALRFSAKLGFGIEDKTLAAIREKASLARNLAAERIWTELRKMLLCDCAGPLRELFSSGLLSHMAKPGVFDFSVVDTLPCCSNMRMAAVCAILEKNGACNTENLTEALKLDKLTMRQCCAAVKWALGTDRDKKLLLSEAGIDGGQCAYCAVIALGEKLSLDELDAVISSGDCIFISDLAVNGDDLKSCGISGREIGKTLNLLLRHVHAYPEDNEKEILLKIVKAE